MKQRNDILYSKIISEGLSPIDVVPDGNCFYRAISLLTTGNENNHAKVRQSIADLIEQGGEVLNGIIFSDDVEFDEYISALRSDGNYKYVGEETAIAAAEIYKRDVYIYSALMPPQPYQPMSSPASFHPIKLAFYEPNHYMALEDNSNLNY